MDAKRVAAPRRRPSTVRPFRPKRAAIVIRIWGAAASPIALLFMLILQNRKDILGKYRATPGKMACGLEVLSPVGGQISVMRAVGRHFAEILSGMVLMVGYLMVLEIREIRRNRRMDAERKRLGLRHA